MSRFAPRRAGDVARLIEQEMLALVITHDDAGYIATPLPLLAETDADGNVCALVGHFACTNPHVDRIARQPEALVTVMGPHGAIPTAPVTKPGWAPTWNYAFAQFEVTVRLEPELTEAAVRDLVSAVEGTHDSAWTTERMGARYESLIGHVIGFRATVRRSSARFKLGQDEDRTTFAEILSHLRDSPLADAMRQQADDEPER
jgi:transcriptional regulator